MYGERLEHASPVIPWMVIHAAAIMSRFKVGKDGKTPLQRIKGKSCNRAQIEFGECVTYLKPKSKGVNKADPRWKEGVYLGMKNRSEEYLMDE